MDKKQLVRREGVDFLIGVIIAIGISLILWGILLLTAFAIFT